MNVKIGVLWRLLIHINETRNNKSFRTHLPSKFFSCFTFPLHTKFFRFYYELKRLIEWSYGTRDGVDFMYE